MHADTGCTNAEPFKSMSMGPYMLTRAWNKREGDDNLENNDVKKVTEAEGQKKVVFISNVSLLIQNKNNLAENTHTPVKQ